MAQDFVAMGAAAADATPTEVERWIDDTEQATPVADHAPFDDSDRAPGHQPQDSEIEAHWHSSPEDALEETRAPLPVDEEFPVEQAGEYREQGFGHAAIDDGQPGTAMPGAAREPSIVELVERFAKALQQHRETTRLEQVQPPVGVSESDEDETFDGPAATAEEGYSSLLAMTGSVPSQRDAVRHDDVAQGQAGPVEGLHNQAAHPARRAFGGVMIVIEQCRPRVIERTLLRQYS